MSILNENVFLIMAFLLYGAYCVNFCNLRSRLHLTSGEKSHNE